MISKYSNIFCQAILLILICIQGTLIYLSLHHKGIPISGSLIQKYVPENLNLSSKEILFYLPYHFRLIDPKFTQKADNLLHLDSPEIFISWRPNLWSLKFNLWKIHSYSGKLRSKLYPSSFELNRLSLLVNGDRIHNARMHFRSDDKIMHLNYSARKYLELQKQPSQKNEEKITLTEFIASSINQNNDLFTFTRALSTSKNSYIECYLEKDEGANYNLSSFLCSESIEFKGNKINALEIRSNHSLNSAENNTFFRAANFLSKEIPIRLNSISGKLNLIDQIKVRSIQVHAKSTLFKNIKFDALTTEIKLKNNENYVINGILFQKSHFLNFYSNYKIRNQKNSIFTKGYLNLNDLKNDYTFQLKDIYIPFSKSIFARTILSIDDNMNLISAQGNLQGELIINTTPIEFFSSDFEWIDQKLKTKNIFKINNRISYAKTDFNAYTGNYAITLNGTTFSTDFNSFMPEWWRNTFRDFSYSSDSSCFHDFAIYGTIDSPIPNFYLGSVKAENMNYKGIPIKYGNVLVQGMNHCSEIRLKDVRTSTDYAEGVITITNNPDKLRKPESIRIKLKSELSIDTAAKLFGDNVRKILSNFKSQYTHKVDYESVFFNPHYSQHDNKSYYDLNINCTNPISFFNRRFDKLSAKIYGRGLQHFIRSGSAEFAAGQLGFEADIRNLSSKAPHLSINFTLLDSSYIQCIENIFQNKFGDINLSNSPSLDIDLAISSEGPLLDLTKHNGYGNLEISGAGLGEINLLGPFSKALEEINISIGIFSLDHLKSNFLIQKESINVHNLEINGKESQVFGKGQIWIPDQSIDFNMKVDLFKNRNLSFSKLGNIGKIFNPMTRILNFTVSGTLKDQKWRSIFDPRNLLK